MRPIPLTASLSPLLVACLALAACQNMPVAADPSTAPSNDGAPVSRASRVEVGRDPPASRACASIGMVSGTAHRAFRDLESAVDTAREEMRERAAAKGADYVREDAIGGDSSQVLVSGTAYRCGAPAAASARDDGEGAATRRPPSGAAGFDFGITADKAEALCRGSRQTWSTIDTAAAKCSGPVVDTGLGGDVALAFCGDRVCRIGMTVSPGERTSRAWVDAFARLKGALQEKYGEPATHDARVPTACRDDLLPCLDDGRASVEVTWRWSSGRRIVLRMGTLDGGGDDAIRLRYEEAAGVRAQAAGL